MCVSGCLIWTLFIFYDVAALIFKDLKVLRTPSPVPRPPPIESAYPDTFTVDQIMNLYQQVGILCCLLNDTDI